MEGKIAIVGGGVSGLTVGYELLALGIDPDRVVVLEGAERPGGNIRTFRADGLVLEEGPNGFLDNAPATMHLVQRLGLAEQLLPSDESAARRYIYRAGKLREIETHPVRFLKNGVLPFGSALRVALEPFQKKGGANKAESVYDFASRRIGKGAASVLVDAMVSGVFAGNARELELVSAFPKMAAMEETYGSLVKAMMAKKRAQKVSGGPAGPGGKLTSFKDGFDTLPNALARHLGDRVRCNTRVLAIESTAKGYKLKLDGEESMEAVSVVLATPAHVTSGLISSIDPNIAASTAAIYYPPVTVVATIYNGVSRPPQGFGFLVPRGQGLKILGCLWSSSIWPGRCADGQVVLRTMVGGAHDPQSAQLDDAAVVELVTAELNLAMGPLPAPSSAHIFRHPQAIGQYQPGHQALLADIDKGLEACPGLFLSGSAYRGISVNHCIEEAPAIAKRVFHYATMLSKNS